MASQATVRGHLSAEAVEYADGLLAGAPNPTDDQLASLRVLLSPGIWEAS